MKKGNKKFSKIKNSDRVVDLSKQEDFLFNKTPILSSALEKLKNKGSKPKPINKPKLLNFSNN